MDSHPDSGSATGEPLDRALTILCARLGPLRERRIPIYHLDEVAIAARALATAWAQAAPAELVAQLAAHPAGEQLLAPAIECDAEGVILRILAPEAVCRAFDDQAGHLDSHTEFGR